MDQDDVLGSNYLDIDDLELLKDILLISSKLESRKLKVK